MKYFHVEFHVEFFKTVHVEFYMSHVEKKTMNAAAERRLVVLERDMRAKVESEKKENERLLKNN